VRGIHSAIITLKNTVSLKCLKLPAIECRVHRVQGRHKCRPGMLCIMCGRVRETCVCGLRGHSLYAVRLLLSVGCILRLWLECPSAAMFDSRIDRPRGRGPSTVAHHPERRSADHQMKDSVV
jgi:hypothetical protein